MVTKERSRMLHQRESSTFLKYIFSLESDANKYAEYMPHYGSIPIVFAHDPSSESR